MNMKVPIKVICLAAVPLVLIALLVWGGCGSKKGGCPGSEGSDATPLPGSAGRGPDMQGTIESSAPFRPAPGSDILAEFVVAALPGTPCPSDRVSVTITRSTRILEGDSLDGGKEVDLNRLGPGVLVDIWFAGPFTLSYPAQGAAEAILIPPGCDSVPQADIEMVKERYAEELMAIPGVVGVGIGEDGGSPRIVVMLANDSGEARERIPAELEGFKVEVVVTGEIRPF